MIDLEKYIEKFKRRGEPLEFCAPVSLLEIKAVEESLGLEVNKQYKEFLQTIGGISVFNNWINGIPKDSPLSVSAGHLYGDTKRMRGLGLPLDYLVIKTSEEEFAWCINGVDMNDLAVYAFEIPFRGKVIKVADDFYSFLEDDLQNAIKAIDEF